MGPLKLPVAELFWFAVVGLAATVIIGGGAILWVGYHVVRALMLYLGAG